MLIGRMCNMKNLKSALFLLFLFFLATGYSKNHSDRNFGDGQIVFQGVENQYVEGFFTNKQKSSEDSLEVGFQSPIEDSNALKYIYLEAKGACFYPTNSMFRKIYGSTGGIYGIESTLLFRKGIALWASFDCFYQSGFSIGSRNPTDITIVPFGIGLKYFVPISFVDLYLGAGVLGSYLHMHDQSPYVVKKPLSWGVGPIVKLGAIFNLPRFVFLDLFVNYSYTQIGFNDKQGKPVDLYRADISNCLFGVGIGYRFGL
jgi:hypothetical protein